MCRLLPYHDVLGAEGLATQLVGTLGEVIQAALGTACEGLTEA